VAFAGRHAWAGHDLSGVVWQTSDAGRSWRLATAPRYLDPGSDAWSRVMLSGHGRLVVASGAGPVQSRDGGRTWTPARWPSAPAAAIAEGRNAYIVEGINKTRARLVTPAGTRSLRLPSGVRNPVDVAFTSARNGILVAADSSDAQIAYATHDGGRTWVSVRPPRGRHDEPELVLAPGLIVLFDDHSSVSATTDEGAHWQSLDAPEHGRDFSFHCGASRPSAQDIWITCVDTGRTILFRSGDAGRTWTRRVSDRILNAELRGTGGPDAWATSSEHPETRSTSTLWHTTDGGATGPRPGSACRRSPARPRSTARPRLPASSTTPRSAADCRHVRRHGKASGGHRADRQRQRPLHRPGSYAVGKPTTDLAHRRRQPLDAFMQRSPRNPGIVELGAHVPRTQPELQAAAGQCVRRGGLAREQRGIPEADVEDVGAKADALADHPGRNERAEWGRPPRGDPARRGSRSPAVRRAVLPRPAPGRTCSAGR
jgi:photosystem II stability/assembly factor-like uncharacterized protein